MMRNWPFKLSLFSLVFVLLLNSNTVQAQHWADSTFVKPDMKWNKFLKPAETLNKKRFYPSMAAYVGGYVGVQMVLWNVWYKDIKSSSFNWKNDNQAWKQVDKFGHAYTAYVETVAGIRALRWMGMKEKHALIFGGLTGTLMQTPYEIFDGFTEEYGASWGDLVANTTGSVIAVVQEGFFKRQIVQMKFAATKRNYSHEIANPLAQQGAWETYDEKANRIYGETFGQRLLKDYNTQTYWFSVNMKDVAFRNNENFPAWLNLAVGYGADGFLLTNGLYTDRSLRYRQYYLSLDFDLTRVKTRSRTLRLVLDMMNTLKVPLPTLELNTQGGRGNLKFLPLHF